MLSRGCLARFLDVCTICWVLRGSQLAFAESGVCSAAECVLRLFVVVKMFARRRLKVPMFVSEISTGS